MFHQRVIYEEWVCANFWQGRVYFLSKDRIDWNCRNAQVTSLTINQLAYIVSMNKVILIGRSLLEGNILQDNVRRMFIPSMWMRPEKHWISWWWCRLVLSIQFAWEANVIKKIAIIIPCKGHLDWVFLFRWILGLVDWKLVAKRDYQTKFDGHLLRQIVNKVAIDLTLLIDCQPWNAVTINTPIANQNVQRLTIGLLICIWNHQNCFQGFTNSINKATGQQDEQSPS